MHPSAAEVDHLVDSIKSTIKSIDERINQRENQALQRQNCYDEHLAVHSRLVGITTELMSLADKLHETDRNTAEIIGVAEIKASGDGPADVSGSPTLSEVLF